MGHNINAIIGKAPINVNAVEKYGLAVAYEAEFAIIILDFESLNYWSSILNLSDESQSENLMWECELIFFFAQELGLEKFGLIQTNYFAGIGSQCAGFFDNGKKKIEGDINIVLKQIGVERNLNLDEFDTINLAEYRESEDYYSDSDDNKALEKANMIPGRFFNKN